MNLGLYPYRNFTGESHIMSELKVMMFDEGTDHNIRCRLVSDWFKIESYVPNKEKLLSEIDKNDPDVVFIDLDIYVQIDGIKTTHTIRTQFDIPVMYIR